MKKEFLTNFQVAGQPLPAEVVEAILQEHQRAVNAAVAPFAYLCRPFKSFSLLPVGLFL